MKTFANIYANGVAGNRGQLYATRDLADQLAAPDRTACVEIEYEPGQGLNRVPASRQDSQGQ